MRIEQRKEHLLWVIGELEKCRLSTTHEIMISIRKGLLYLNISEDNLRKMAEDLLILCKKHITPGKKPK